MLNQRIFITYILSVALFLSGAMLLPGMAQDTPQHPVPVGEKSAKGEGVQKKKLVLESYRQLGLAQRLQRKCRILPDGDSRAMRYYAGQMRQFLVASESVSAIAQLNGQIRKVFKARVRKSAGNIITLCNKETMLQLEDSLTSANLVNGLIGSKPFDARADTNQEIMRMLKASARLQGAARQCPGQMKESSFEAMVQKNALNTLVLSAMGTMHGIDRKTLGRIKLISAQTATRPEWKTQCRIEVFLAHNKKMEQLIAKIRQ